MIPPLRIHNLIKSYAGHPVLHGVDLQVEPATIHGLVGLNGAGKTTTMECMLGLQAFDRGEVSVLGHEPGCLHHSNGKVAVVFDEPYLPAHFKVEDVLRLAQLTVNRRDNGYLDRVLDLLGLQRFRQFKVRNLSLGNRRRAAIAQALVSKPEFVVLDEPFNGLDAGGVDEVLALIRDLNSSEGITFLLASHQLPYLESICSHMAILHRGKISVSDNMNRLLSKDREEVAIKVDDPNAAKALLEKMAGAEIVEVGNKLINPETTTGIILCRLRDMSAAELNRQLVMANIEVSELTVHKPSLDALFRKITGANQ